MLDINFIREYKDQIKKAIELKKVDLNLDDLLAIDEDRRQLLSQIEDLRRQRNETAEKRDIERGKQIKEELDVLEKKQHEILTKYDKLMVKVPNIASADTPIGESEADNVEVFKWGEKPQFDFKPLDHIEIGKKLDILDLERGAKVGGYRGYYVKNEGVMLIMGIMMYALNKMVAHGYAPMIPPTLVKEFALFGSGYFKGQEYDGEVDEIYQVATSDKEATGENSQDRKFLVGTAEPSLLAYYANEILDESKLPIKLCGYSQCYRSEIGSYGKDTKGMYRVHEFMKVEQVVLTRANVAEAEKYQIEMLDLSKKMHEEMGLPYRQLQISTGDLSAGKYRQYDLEAWMPGLDRYGETGSASIFLDWQSRRLNVKYQTKDGKKEYVYMLNNTALPSPRIFIAILENFQQSDGSIKIPEVLIPYTHFSEIKPKG